MARRYEDKDAAKERERLNDASTIKLGGKERRISDVVKRIVEVGIPVDVGGEVVNMRVTEDDIRAEGQAMAQLKSDLLLRRPLTKEQRMSASLSLNWMIPLTEPERDAEWRDMMLTLCTMREQGSRTWDAEWSLTLEPWRGRMVLDAHKGQRWAWKGCECIHCRQAARK
jgi:hypothetical protein